MSLMRRQIKRKAYYRLRRVNKMELLTYTNRLKKKEHLMYEEMHQAVEHIFNEETPAEDIADFLIALSAKGETAHELAALATVMKSYANKVNAPEGIYIDNCGT